MLKYLFEDDVWQSSQWNSLQAAMAIAGLMGCFGCSTASLNTPQGELPVEASTWAVFDAEAEAIRRGSQPPDWSEVIQRMEEVLRVDPDNSLAWYNLGVAHTKLQQWSSAVHAYKRAGQLNAGLPSVRENLASVLFAMGHNVEAYAILSQVVEENASAVDARVVLARHLLAEQRVEEARERCVEALTYEPKHVEAYCVLTEVALTRRNYLRVRLLVAQGLKIAPNTACFHDALGQLAHIEGDDGAALVHYERAINADPRRSISHFRIGEISLGYRAYERAQAAFEAVIQLRPHEPQAYINLGVALKGLDKAKAAESAYVKALKVAGDTPLPAAHVNLGLLYLQEFAQYERAEDAFRTYLRQSNERHEEVGRWIAEARRRRSDQRLANEDAESFDEHSDCPDGEPCPLSSREATDVKSDRLESHPVVDASPSESASDKGFPEDMEARRDRRGGEAGTAGEPKDPAGNTDDR